MHFNLHLRGAPLYLVIGTPTLVPIPHALTIVISNPVESERDEKGNRQNDLG